MHTYACMYMFIYVCMCMGRVCVCVCVECVFMCRKKERENNIYKNLNFRKDFATAWMNLGIAQSSLKQYKESETSYFMALQYRSNYPDCYYNLGILVSKVYQNINLNYL